MADRQRTFFDADADSPPRPSAPGLKRVRPATDLTNNPLSYALSTPGVLDERRGAFSQQFFDLFVEAASTTLKGAAFIAAAAAVVPQFLVSASAKKRLVMESYSRTMTGLANASPSALSIACTIQDILNHFGGGSPWPPRLGWRLMHSRSSSSGITTTSTRFSWCILHR
jgi:hypothetical protein